MLVDIIFSFGCKKTSRMRSLIDLIVRYALPRGFSNIAGPKDFPQIEMQKNRPKAIFYFLTTFFAAGFFATTFFVTGFFTATFFTAGFFATTFFATGFFTATFFAAGFLATTFFAAGFFAATFFTAGLAAGFAAALTTGFFPNNAIFLSFQDLVIRNKFYCSLTTLYLK
ncbi:MAG: hypothetical protein LBO08_01335 [Rickettsiales bacterium]|nr:hypothetical protein [Rickettsiales bacterium]